MWTAGLKMGLTVVLTVGALLAGMAGAKQIPVGDIENRVARMDKNMPSRVKEGVRDALAGDEVVRIAVNAIVDDQLTELIERNNEVIADLRAEMTKSRESLTAAIENQTKHLSRDIGELQSEMSRVRSTQNILLQRLGVVILPQ